VVNIAGVKLGGQPGEFLQSWLVHITTRPKMSETKIQGLFDKAKAEKAGCKAGRAIGRDLENPAILHVYASTIKAFERIPGFCGRYLGRANHNRTLPILQSGRLRPNLSQETGYADKVIYNSISLATNSSEEKAIRDSEIDSAILLAYNPAEPGLDGSIKVLETGGRFERRG